MAARPHRLLPYGVLGLRDLAELSVAGAAGAAPLAREAVRAVDRAVAAWLEGHTRLLAALGADGGVHGALRAPVPATRVVPVTGAVDTAVSATRLTTAGLASSPAIHATRRCVLEALGRVELLLTSGEYERLAAITAGECLIGVAQR